MNLNLREIHMNMIFFLHSKYNCFPTQEHKSKIFHRISRPVLRLFDCKAGVLLLSKMHMSNFSYGNLFTLFLIFIHHSLPIYGKAGSFFESFTFSFHSGLIVSDIFRWTLTDPILYQPNKTEEWDQNYYKFIVNIVFLFIAHPVPRAAARAAIGHVATQTAARAAPAIHHAVNQAATRAADQTVARAAICHAANPAAAHASHAAATPAARSEAGLPWVFTFSCFFLFANPISPEEFETFHLVIGNHHMISHMSTTFLEIIGIHRDMNIECLVFTIVIIKSKQPLKYLRLGIKRMMRGEIDN
ncbi:hypothetical protein ACJX0J_031528, partial [Zea mays]